MRRGARVGSVLAVATIASCAVVACEKRPPALVLPVPPPPPAASAAAEQAAPVPPPPPAAPHAMVKSLSLDLYYGCALYQDGRAACWGQREGRDSLTGTPRIVEGVPALDLLHVGSGFACGRASADRSLWCWGENHAGQLGTRRVTAGIQGPHHVLERSGQPMIVDGFLVGSGHVCALAPGGTVSCWGSSISGECGRAGKHDAMGDWIPVLEPNVVFRGATRIYGGANTSCAVDTKEQLFCWGSQDAGYSGKGDTAAPRRIAVVGRVQSMAFASGHGCLLNDAGAVFCRGWNAGGQLGSAGRPQKVMDGMGPWHDDYQPELVRVVELGKTYTSLAASRHETCAVSTDHDVTCLGTPDWTTSLERSVTAGDTPPAPSPWRPHCVEQEVPAPQLGAGSAPRGGSGASSLGAPGRFTRWSCSPTPEPNLTDVAAVVANMGRRCTLHLDGRVRCVGLRQDGRRRWIDDSPVLLELPL